MPRQTWLADVARSAGLTVVEASGWRTRGNASFAPRGLVWHHTATPATWSRAQLQNLLTAGHSTLSGPLCNYQLDRDGTVTVIAAGRANHAGAGGWRGLSGNTSVIGIEAANNGVGESWPQAQMDAYRRLSAAVLGRLGASTEMMCGHKEWAPSRKIDPRGIDMGVERNRVGQIMAGPAPTPPPTQPVDEFEEWYMSLSKQEQDDLRAFVRAFRSGSGDPVSGHQAGTDVRRSTLGRRGEEANPEADAAFVSQLRREIGGRPTTLVHLANFYRRIAERTGLAGNNPTGNANRVQLRD